jgi:uncharacterized phage-associated protein
MVMATVHDVAEYILKKRGDLSPMKLQKLVYYSQAWAYVWNDRPLFTDRIEAWANGPVVPELYERHKGKYLVSSIGGNPDALTTPEQEAVDKVLEFYGDKSPQWLSDLTHMERPWREARAGLPDGARSNNEISLDIIGEYYSSLPPKTAE